MVTVSLYSMSQSEAGAVGMPASVLGHENKTVVSVKLQPILFL